MGQTTIVLMLITILSKILGFVRESVMAAYIGAGELKSIYTTASTIPTILATVVATGIVSGYIPVFNKIKSEKSEIDALDFSYNLINMLMIYGSIVLIIVLIFAEPISKLLSPKLEGDSLRLAVNYTRIIMFSIYALLYSSVIKGYLNIKGNFLDPAFTGIILNIFLVIATIFTGIYKHPYILILGALFAYIIEFIRFPHVAKKLGFNYKKILDFSDPYIKELLIIVIPIIISTAADQISLLIDNSMASAFFGVSSISKIYYSKTMLNFIMGVVTLSVSTVTFPDIAKSGQAGDIKAVKSKTKSAIIFSMILVIPATLGMIALANPIIKIAFERNAFTSSDTVIVVSLMVSYAPYIIFASLLKIVANGFYSIGDSKTPLLVIIIQQIVNVTLNIMLSKIFGLDGLAYSTSISSALGGILLLVLFYKKIGKIEDKTGKLSMIKISLLSVIIAVLAKIIFDYLSKSYSLVLSVFVAVALVGVIYIIGIIFLKIPELNQLLERFKEKLSV